MNTLADIQEKLEDTRAVIAVTERALAENPSPAVLAGLNSLRKRQERLEEMYRDAAKSNGAGRDTPAMASHTTLGSES
jgi:hypothetical protein